MANNSFWLINCCALASKTVSNCRLIVRIAANASDFISRKYNPISFSKSVSIILIINSKSYSNQCYTFLYEWICNLNLTVQYWTPKTTRPYSQSKYILFNKQISLIFTSAIYTVCNFYENVSGNSFPVQLSAYW